MSVPSFPRPEHIALVRTKIEARLRNRGLALEVAERGLNQLKCQYRFGFRRRLPEDSQPPADASENGPENDPGQDWAELLVHFQTAQRLEEGRGEAELDRMLENFLSAHFC